MRSHRYEQSIFLNRLLSYLGTTGQAYPVPWRLDPKSEAILRQAASLDRGLIVCSAHLPLIKMAVRAFMEIGQSPTVGIAAKPDADGHIGIWGHPKRLPAFKVQPNVLLRARTELRNRGSILLLVDTIQGDYSPNIFRLAHATGATVLFFTAELNADGMVAVRVFPPPFPDCGNPREITGNLLALDAAVKGISGEAPEKLFDTIPAGRLT